MGHLVGKALYRELGRKIDGLSMRAPWNETWYAILKDVFERLILQCLERGTLQSQPFDNPQSSTHAFLRGVVGGFLRLEPVKQALMSDGLRSRFLRAMQAGAARQAGRETVPDL